MADAKPNPRRGLLGPVRGSYVVLANPKANDHGELRYSIQMLFPKSDKALIAKAEKLIKAAILACPLAGGDPEKAKKLWNNPKFGKPLRDAEAEDRDGPEYKDVVFANAGTNDKKGRPGCILKNGTKVTDPDEIMDHFFSGAWYQVSVTAFYYDNSGNKGIGFALNNVMKWKNDVRLDGSVDAEDEFADLIDENDFNGEDEIDFDDKPTKPKGKGGKPAKPADDDDDWGLDD